MTVLAHKGDETAFFWYNSAELFFEGEKAKVDYLEGLLLGRLWSDTDFENRRHLSLFLLYGVFVDLLVVYNYMTGGMNMNFTSVTNGDCSSAPVSTDAETCRKTSTSGSICIAGLYWIRKS